MKRASIGAMSLAGNSVAGLSREHRDVDDEAARYRPAAVRCHPVEFGASDGARFNCFGSRFVRRDRANARSVDMNRASIGAMSLAGSIVWPVSRASTSA
jgi:hypothetical protein